jgi:hypothetical protein
MTDDDPTVPMHIPPAPDLRTTTEKEADDNAAEARGNEPERTYDGETRMAEEPIEQRLLRAWLNGFREGAERASWGGRWDR